MRVDYFRHNVNSRSDLSLSLVLDEFGAEGYGRYWLIIELLYIAEDQMIELSNLTKRSFASSWKCNLEEVDEFIAYLVDVELMTIEGDMLYSNGVMKRVSMMRETKEELAEKRREAGRKGAEARWRKENEAEDIASTPKMTPEPNEEQRKEIVESVTETVQTSVRDRLEGFDEFWDLYPKKRAKQAAERAWKNLSMKAKAEAMGALPDHVKQKDWQKQGGQFVPNPATWLNGKRWLDEVEGVKPDTRAEEMESRQLESFIDGDWL